MTALLCLALGLAAVMIPNTAKAEGSKLFTIKYDNSAWYFQTSEDSRWMGVTEIGRYFNAGDSIVVNGVAGNPTFTFTIDTYVGDVCVSGPITAIIYANGGAAKAYAAYGGVAVVNGNVDTVLASANGTVQVNGNVNILSADYSSGNALYGISGTVNKATAKINSETVDTYYSIKAGKMTPDANGIVWLNNGDYSKDPNSVPASSATTTPANTANNNQLDDVPKTGSFVFEISIVLLAVAVVMGIASVVLLKKKTR